ncbi:MAG: class F sortase [Patescibacteria group bacterium]
MIAKLTGILILGLINITGLRSKEVKVIRAPDKGIEAKVIGSNKVMAQEESFEPHWLEIEKIDLSVEVIGVGLNEKKAMIVPEENNLVSWYKNGTVPGEVGSAVLSGHYEWREAGVFKRLGEVEVGDIIKLKDNNGTEKLFRVSKRAIYDKNNFPMKEVFSSKDKKRLNLITCYGRFNRATKLYEDRLVVFAELEE